MSFLLALLLAAEGAPAPLDPALTLGPQEALKQGKAAYEYGNYAATIDQLEKLTRGRALESPTDQVEAFRLLGLAHFFAKQPDDARRAFLNLLSLDPDFQLDALYVPPPAIAFFEKVRADNQALLEPIRLRRRATQQAIAQEEAARQRLLAQTLGNGAPPTVIRERIDRPNPALALLPFGIGQFQNGNRPLGIALATLEALTLAASIGCYVWVESQRLPDGNYSASTYPTTVTVREIQIATGAGFGALWLAGAGEALLKLRAPIVTREGVTTDPPPTDPPAPKLGATVAPIPGGAEGTLSLRW